MRSDKFADSPDPRDLRAGYATNKARGAGHFAGALRHGERIVWRCDEFLGHDHTGTALAIRCGDAELERRRQGAREVFELLHCEAEDLWFTPAQGKTGQALDDGRCPRCFTRLTRAKVFVLEREPA